MRELSLPIEMQSPNLAQPAAIPTGSGCNWMLAGHETNLEYSTLRTIMSGIESDPYMMRNQTGKA